MATNKKPLILGSASPRRLHLLNQIGVEPDKVVDPNIDEGILTKEKPLAYVQRMALEKNLAIKKQPKFYVLSADTIVVLGTQILCKPINIDEAKNCIEQLSGRRHRVYTAIAVSHKGKVKTKTVCTLVTFKRVCQEEIDYYLNFDEWKGKAGGYAIQGLGSRFIKRVNGSHSNVIGLPVVETLNLLSGLGYEIFN